MIIKLDESQKKSFEEIRSRLFQEIDGHSPPSHYSLAEVPGYHEQTLQDSLIKLHKQLIFLSHDEPDLHILAIISLIEYYLFNLEKIRREENPERDLFNPLGLGTGASSSIAELILISILRHEGIQMPVRLEVCRVYTYFNGVLFNIFQSIEQSSSLPFFTWDIADFLSSEMVTNYRRLGTDLIYYTASNDPAVRMIAMIALNNFKKYMPDCLSQMSPKQAKRVIRAHEQMKQRLNASKFKLPYLPGMRRQPSWLPRTEHGARKAIKQLMEWWDICMTKNLTDIVCNNIYNTKLSKLHLYSHKKATCDFLLNVEFEYISDLNLFKVKSGF